MIELTFKHARGIAHVETFDDYDEADAYLRDCRENSRGIVEIVVRVDDGINRVNGTWEKTADCEWIFTAHS